MDPLEITPEEFELHVKRILEEEGLGLKAFQTQHLEKVSGTDGDYFIDVTVRFQALDVDFLVLVECKRHSSPIKRELVQVFSEKIRSSGAQKGILFATADFQKGAVEYAKIHGIALVTVQDGKNAFVTKAVTPPDYHPPWLPPVVGYLVYISDEGSITLDLVGKIGPPEWEFSGDGTLRNQILENG